MFKNIRNLSIVSLTALSLATALACASARADDRGNDAQTEEVRARAMRDAERAMERAAIERERAHDQIERERTRFEALSTEEREKAQAAAREELARAQEELSRMAAKMAELSVHLQGQDLDRALRVSRLGRPIIGVVLDEDAQRGVRLSAVTPGGPAAQAGLRAGDRIVAVNGKRVQSDDPTARLDIARELIGRPDEGEKVSLEVESGGKTRKVEVEARNMGSSFLREFDPETLRGMVSPRWAFEVAPIAPMVCTDNDKDCSDLFHRARAWRGLRLSEVDRELGRYFGTERGVLVLRNEEKIGDLKGGDVILEVDGKTVDDPSEFMGRLREGEPKQPRDLALMRDHKRLRIKVETPDVRTLPFLFELMPPAPPAPPAPPGHPAAARPPTPPTPPAPVTPDTSRTPVAVPAPVAPPPPPPRQGVLARVLQ